MRLDAGEIVRFARRVDDGFRYQLVRLKNGACSIRSVTAGETFHPVIGPVAEAEALYVRQLNLAERMRAEAGDFVIWDVGLGGGANALTVLDRTRGMGSSLHIVSFDHTLEPLRFAVKHADELGYFAGFECEVARLIDNGSLTFSDGGRRVKWELRPGDFPTLIADPVTNNLPAPHAILFDAYSPAKNPAMWTLPLFEGLFRHLRPGRSCALPTYSRSTLLRVTLLLAGFFVGVGHATGEKEETTIASNTLALIDEPLALDWLNRARSSTSAEPLLESVYRQAPLTEASFSRLVEHPQFRDLFPDESANLKPANESASVAG